jgi:hypothetical protein
MTLSRQVDEARLRKHIDDCGAGCASAEDAEDIADALREYWRREANDIPVAQDALPVTMSLPLLPLVAWNRIPDCEADAALEQWGHWLGASTRPFGRQSFGLWLGTELVAVAVSASTVNRRCAGFDRRECVELARLCAHPEHRNLTRVALRLWRITAPPAWSSVYWQVRACVSYANAIRHTGDIYRFDGWRKVADVPGGIAGGNWGRGKQYDPKSVWVFVLENETNMDCTSSVGRT